MGVISSENFGYLLDQKWVEGKSSKLTGNPERAIRSQVPKGKGSETIMETPKGDGIVRHSEESETTGSQGLALRRPTTRGRGWNLKHGDRWNNWTDEMREKVRKSSMRHPKLNNEEWLCEEYLNKKRTTVDIAKELGCVNSTVFCALNRFHIPRRSRKEACKKGSEHHLWRGGTGFRSDTRYAEWRTMVYGRDNFTCRMCGKRGVYFHAHHIFPCRDFADLKYEVDNGITLCVPCHKKTYNKEIYFVDYFKSLVQKNPNSVEPVTGNAVGNTEPSNIGNDMGVCRDYGDSSKEMI